MLIKANGIQTNYVLSGKKDGPVVMMSHSLGSSVVMWEPQMAALEPHFRVLRYDTRGHGGTEVTPGGYTLELLAKDAVGLIDALGIKDVHWVGLSMGGMIGQCLGLNHADRVRSLVLCDTSTIVPNEMQPVWQERIDRARSKGMEALVEETMERWFTAPYIKKSPEMFKLICNQFLATPVQGFIGCGEAIRRLNFLERLSLINKPTLIIAGDDDPSAPAAGIKGMQERIKGARVAVLPSARHISNVEQAEAFNAALLKFLQAL
jgi:3-oxoadipate enol-lactonase